MKRDPIDIISYQEIWLKQFEQAKKDLDSALGTLAVCIEHIGSTAIQNMPSKDRIDIQIGVKEVSDEVCEVINAALQDFGFSYAYLSKDHLPPNESDENEWKKIYLPGITHRWRFKANIHIRRVGAKNYKYALLFRDFLRNHPESATAYARLKQSLSKHTRFDRDAYCEIKDPVYDLIMINARIWEKSLSQA